MKKKIINLEIEDNAKDKNGTKNWKKGRLYMR